MAIDPVDLPSTITVDMSGVAQKLLFAGCNGVEAIYKGGSLQVSIPLNEGVDSHIDKYAFGSGSPQKS